MSETPAERPLGEQLAGRWQIPLLVGSAVLLLAGLWRIRPTPVPPDFDALYPQAVNLYEAELYPEASAYVEKLLATPEFTPEQVRRLHALMAKVIFAHESGNAVHGPSNAQAILEHGEAGLGPGEPHDAESHHRRALAFEWLRQPAHAIEAYQAALDAGIGDPWTIRKRTIEIRRRIGGVPSESLHADYDAFITGDGVPTELRYWAAEQKVELYGLADEHDEAERFLDQHAQRFRDAAVREDYDYLQALAWFHVGRYEDAERLLRALRDRLRPGDMLYPRSGWLLGRVLQVQEAPEYALSFFDDVMAHAPPGPYRVAAQLGRGESLASLQRYDESIASFKEAIARTTEDPYASLIDLRAVRELTTALHQKLMVEKKLEESMAYLRLAAELAPPADAEAQALYAERFANLAFALGERSSEDARSAAPAVGAETAESYFREAADHYLRLAKLTRLDTFRSSEAIWQAADAYDLGGRRDLTIDLLETFIDEQPASTLVPRALLRLGEAYQAKGDFDGAIERYRRNLIDHPRTPSAIASLVPLADCFIATEAFDKAAETLLRIVEREPADKLSLITPEAAEYADALFRLGDLHRRTGQYERAVERYAEAIERYPDDARANGATYLLADSFRRSAGAILEELESDAGAGRRDALTATYQQRLAQARELFTRVIDRYDAVPESPMGPLDHLYLKLAHFQRADAVYDQARVAGPGDTAAYGEALEMYDRAAWAYQDDPLAMSAYVQVMRCHLRLGEVEKARMALQRAKWALQGIGDEQFAQYAPQEDRAFWQDYLAWLERTPTLTPRPQTDSG